MAYRVFNNVGYLISDRFEHGFLIVFENQSDFQNYQFRNVYGRQIVQAIWSSSGHTDPHSILQSNEDWFTKVWFTADRIIKN